jgi:hypothetical protein
MHGMSDEAARKVRPIESNSVSDEEGDILKTVVNQLLTLKSGVKSEEPNSISTALEKRSRDQRQPSDSRKDDGALEKVRAKRRHEQKKYRERVKHRQVELAASVGALEAELSMARAEREVLLALQSGLLQLQAYQTGLFSSIYKIKGGNRTLSPQAQPPPKVSQLVPKAGPAPSERENQEGKDRSWSWAFWELISNYPEIWSHLCNLLNNHNEKEVLGTQYCELLSKFRADARAALESLKHSCSRNYLVSQNLRGTYDSLSRNSKVS